MKKTGYSDKNDSCIDKKGLFQEVVMFKQGLEAWEGAHEKSGLKSIQAKRKANRTFFSCKRPDGISSFLSDSLS